MSFTIDEGEFVGFLPNDAGKTTTLKMLSELFIPAGTASVLHALETSTGIPKTIRPGHSQKSALVGSAGDGKFSLE